MIYTTFETEGASRVENLRAGLSASPGPAEISGRNGPGRSSPILFLSVFLKDVLKKIWSLYRNGPAQLKFGPDRPGPI